MSQKAQAGLEYLMTYGWALVIIASVVGVLVFVINPTSTTASFSSSDPSKIMLKGSSITENTAGLILQNITGGTISVNSISFLGDLMPSNDFKLNDQSSFPVDIAIGGEMNFDGLSSSVNCEAGGTIAIFYTDALDLEREVKINCNGGAPMPVVWFRFEENSGETVFDSSGNEINGTLIPTGAGPSWQTENCLSGSCLSFDGADDSVEITNIPVDTTPGARNTVEFLMYWDGSDSRMPFGWQSYDLWNSSGCFGFNTFQGNVYGIPSAGLINKWVNVRAIFYNGVPSAENNALYIDGVKQNIYACSGITAVSKSVSTNAQISGYYGSSGYKFGGKIDDFKIYNQAIE